MSDTEAKKKWKKENIKSIQISYTINKYNNIKSIASDNNIKLVELFKGCFNYCMDNNISIEDIKQYIK